MKKKTTRGRFESLEHRDLLTAFSFKASEREFAADYTAVQEIDIADINSDGSLDIVSMVVTEVGGNAEIRIHENVTGEFEATQWVGATNDHSRFGLTVANRPHSETWQIGWIDRGDPGTQTVSLASNSHRRAEFDVAESSREFSLEFANVDGEGELELVYRNAWFEPLTQTRHEIGPAGSVARSGDFNGDGATDFVSYVPARPGVPAMLSVYKVGVGDVAAEVLTELELQHDLESFVVADFDNDGDSDVFAVSRNDDSNDPRVTISVFRSNRVAFQTQPTLTLNETIENLQLADIDADGDLDIAASTFGIAGDHISWLQNSDSVFAAPVVIMDQVIDQSDFGIADIDGDGTLDIVASSHQGTIQLFDDVLEKHGQSMEPLTNPGVGARAILQSVDFDHDGYADLLSASPASEVLLIHRNDGTGSFGRPRVLVSDVGRVTGFEVPDIDNDGDFDLLITRSDTGQVLLMKNRGESGGFDTIQIGPRVLNPWPATARDFDDDGDLDILTWTPGESKIVLHANDIPSATFVPREIWIGNAASSMATMDADMDGSLDLVVTFSNGDVFRTGFLSNASGFSTLHLMDRRRDTSVLAVGNEILLTGRDEHGVHRYRDWQSRVSFWSDLTEPALHADPFNLKAPNMLVASHIGTFFVPLTEEHDEIRLDDRAGYSLAVNDFDNDGDSDIFVSTDLGIRYLENETRLVGDFTLDSGIDVHDMDVLCNALTFSSHLSDPRFDFNLDGGFNRRDFAAFRDLVFDFPTGDADGDGVFDSSDIIQVFRGGVYESPQRVFWSQGDWNCDGAFTSRDISQAFRDGHYGRTATPRQVQNRSSIAAAIDDAFLSDARNRSHTVPHPHRV